MPGISVGLSWAAIVAVASILMRIRLIAIGGVNHDNAGNLSGYAWSPQVGWINFNSRDRRVSIDRTTGEFNGYAWSGNIGWIHFNNSSQAYKVRAELSEDSGSVTPPPPDSGDITPPSDGIGQAILIAASGAHKQNSLFRLSEELTRRMYRVLKQRGYSDEQIVYLNPKTWQDVDGDGLDDAVVDNDLFDPVAALEAAFNQAATLQAGQQFILYIHGHALQNKFKIARDYWLPASELRRLLDKVPTDVPQVIILDSCYSGSFIDELCGTAAQRIILTSSDEQNTAWNVQYENFSDTLIRSLRRGADLKTAFLATEDLIIGDPRLFGEQRPQLDDDGDCVYTSHDGRRAARTVLGNEGMRQADAPEIIDVHSPLILAEQQVEGVLWIRTSPSGEHIKRVRAVLIRPGTQSINYQGEGTDFGREELDLGYNPVQDRYEAVYSHFRQGGQWRILYQAQGQDGTWSDSGVGEVQASGVLAPVTVTARMNQSSYQIGEYLSFKLDIKAELTQPGPYDVYAAIVFPPGYFVTIAYPISFSLPGAIQVYRNEVMVSEPKTFSILDLEIPQGIAPGTYNGCGVVAAAGSDPWQETNWIDIHCKDFLVR
ncbi:MAG: hypothetical protein DRR19_29635 [Candidatus Parabeggiatoa sp. nov. 1]|nr:MAG: hypothetical protein DRR19_29635 [Gammaproteobacteria bacterium]